MDACDIGLHSAWPHMLLWLVGTLCQERSLWNAVSICGVHLIYHGNRTIPCCLYHGCVPIQWVCMACVFNFSVLYHIPRLFHWYPPVAEISKGGLHPLLYTMFKLTDSTTLWRLGPPPAGRFFHVVRMLVRMDISRQAPVVPPCCHQLLSPSNRKSISQRHFFLFLDELIFQQHF